MQLLIDHLWQSTLFALIAALVTLGLRSNAARVRYSIWFAASVKFLLPFAALGWIGHRLGLYVGPTIAAPQLAFVMDVVAAPTAPPAGSWLIPALGSVWLAGSASILTLWLRRYWTMARMADRAPPAGIEAPVAVRLAPEAVGPGIVGLVSPVLLLPSRLITTLTSAELRAVVAHEVTHVQRRDNLTAAVHMSVQALFWFHPLVWWIGAKLVEERERACDEAVLAAGNDAGTYAEAILKVCRFYVSPPLICVPGVSSANLKTRVEQIMAHRTAVRLSLPKRALLGAAAIGAIAVPLAAGWARTSDPLSHLTPEQIAGAPQVPYEAFLAAVERGEVDLVSIVQTRVAGRFTTGEIFRTTAPQDLWSASQKLEVLRNNGVSIMIPPRTDPSRPNLGAAHVYPADSIAAREEGAVVLLLTVDETGDVVAADVDKSSGFQRLDHAAQTVAVNDWRFLAGRMDGEPRTMDMRIRMNFSLSGK